MSIIGVYDDDINRLHAEIEQKQIALNALKEKKELLKREDRKAIAELLHARQCRSNHTDGCGWGYETWDGSTPVGNSTRMEYLKKADKIILRAKELNVGVPELLEIVFI